MNAANLLKAVKKELEFLDQGGYRKPLGSRQPVFCIETPVEWRRPLFFEDSPSCPKERHEACSINRECVLMDLVPDDHRRETVPCRHIPLNEDGDTIASLRRGGAKQGRIEAEVRSWLVQTIARLERTAT